MLRICRTCLRLIEDESFVNLNGGRESDKIKMELAVCVNELDLGLVMDSVICSECTKNLHAAYSFVQQCLHTEKHICKYMQTIHCTSSIFLLEMHNSDLELFHTDSEHSENEERELHEISACTDSTMANYPNTSETFDSLKYFLNQELTVVDNFLDDANENNNNVQAAIISKKLRDKGDTKLSNSDWLDQYMSYLKTPSKEPKRRKTQKRREGSIQIKNQTRNNVKSRKSKISKEMSTSMIEFCEKEVENERRSETHGIEIIPINSNNSKGLRSASSAKLTDSSIRKKRKKEMFYNCEKCDYVAENKQFLTLHVRTHQTTDPFRCNICTYTALSNSDLMHHLKNHSSAKLYTCNDCEYKTKVKSSLIRHLKIHCNDHPYTCNMCNYRTSDKECLIKHKQIHNNEKPFVCPVCDFRTHEKRFLNMHVVIHTGEKPYVCDVCNFKTAHKRSLQAHVKLHTGRKPFLCEYCDFRTAYTYNLSLHQKRVHGNEMDGMHVKKRLRFECEKQSESVKEATQTIIS